MPTRSSARRAGGRVIAAWYDGEPASGSGRNMYRLAADCYRDVSRSVLRALADDPAIGLLLRNRRTGAFDEADDDVEDENG